MEIEIPEEMFTKAARWPELKRWERREMGQELRRLGLCYREIMEVIPVAKGTLSDWCRDIPLSEGQIERIRDRGWKGSAAMEKAAVTRRQTYAARRAAIHESARVEAKELIEDPFWLAGAVAYWSEGSKRVSQLQFSNSDPGLVILFMEWAMRFLDLQRDRFRISLHLHRGQDEAERKQYWSEVTGVPLKNFRKTLFKDEGTGHRKNVLYNGTASVRVTRSTNLLRRVLGWIDLASEKLAVIR